MDDYSLVLFFLSYKYSIHDSVKKAAEYIDWFSHEIEIEKTDLLEVLIRSCKKKRRGKNECC